MQLLSLVSVGSAQLAYDIASDGMMNLAMMLHHMHLYPASTGWTSLLMLILHGARCNVNKMLYMVS